MLKNKIVLILLLFTLSGAVTVKGEIFSEPLINPAQEEAVSPLPVNTEEVEETVELLPPELNEPDSITFKQPASKKQLAKKFLLAMLAVTISSVVLFVLLSLYNRVRQVLLGENGTMSKVSEENEEASLQTPGNLTQAVKTFIDKTKWE